MVPETDRALDGFRLRPPPCSSSPFGACPGQASWEVIMRPPLCLALADRIGLALVVILTFLLPIPVHAAPESTSSEPSRTSIPEKRSARTVGSGPAVLTAAETAKVREAEA